MKTVNLMLMFVALIFLTACKNGGDSKNVKLKDTQWLMLTVNDKKVELPADSKPAFIVFQSDENRYHASAGCNNLGGGYELGEGNALKIGMSMSSMMACEDMTLEANVILLLTQIDSYKIDGDQLSLIGGGKTLATFKAKP